MRTLRTQVKWIMISVIVVFVVTTFWGYGSYSRSGAGRPQGGGDYAVAEVDGRTVMRSQLDRGVLDLAERTSAKDLKDADVVALRKNVLDNIAIAGQLQKELDRSHIEISDEEIKNAIKEIENQFPTKESFQEYMAQTETTEKQLRTQIREDLARRKLLENATAGVVISEDEVLKAYDALKNLIFIRRPSVGVQLARFASPDPAAAAFTRLQGGESWDLVLRAFSDDLLDRSSGDETASFEEGQVPPQIWAAVASVDNGTVVGPVLLGSKDFYVLRRVSAAPGGVLSFDAVSHDVRDMVTSQRRQGAQEVFLGELRNRADVKILDEALFIVSPTSGDVSGDRGTGSADAPAASVEPSAAPTTVSPDGAPVSGEVSGN